MPTIARIHRTRFYVLRWPDGTLSAAIVDDFGNLVTIELKTTS